MTKKAKSVMMRVDEDFAKKVKRIADRLNKRDKRRIDAGKTKPFQAVEVTGWIAEDIRMEDYIE